MAEGKCGVDIELGRIERGIELGCLLAGRKHISEAAGDGFAVIASKGGADAHPLWYRNLQANSGVEVTVGRVTRPMHARDAEGEERDRLWRALADNYAGYDAYAKKTTRRIPVVVLEPVSDMP